MDSTLDVRAGRTARDHRPERCRQDDADQSDLGVLAPDSGRILFEGRDVTALPVYARARLGLARSFQITSILPGFTALENVALAIQAHAGSSFRFFGRASAETAP